ncbi:phage tail tube protein [Vulgatibacter sp.]|uniref:phage tail tube protein n=1 Tax=Vulgatibacter sp. TaxID=1971226 RepID=UPI003561F7A4
MAKIGYGTTVGVESGTTPGTFIPIGGITGFTPPQGSTEEVDVTTMESPDATTESIPGMRTYAAASLTVLADPADPGQIRMDEVAVTREVVNFEGVLSNGETYTFSGFVPQDGVSEVTMGGVITKTYSLKPSGVVTKTAA